MSVRAVFLDKDGTLIHDVPYSVDPSHIRLMRGALEGLRLLREAGYKLVVVSNQSGVARAYFTEAAMADVALTLRKPLAAAGIRLAGFNWGSDDPLAAG